MGQGKQNTIPGGGWTIGESARQPLIRRMLPFLDWSGGLTPAQLRADLAAGLTGAAIVLPQGIAFATIAGLPPEYGLYTAMIPPVIAALFGSSMAMVSGPATAISALLFAALSKDYAPGTPAYVNAALALTLMVGVIQIGCGVARLGRFLGLVSHPVIVAFSSGAAILIVLSQIDSVLGVSLGRPDHLAAYAMELGRTLPETNPYCLAVAVLTMATAITCRRISTRLPQYLIALVVGATASWAIDASANGVTLVSKVPAVLPQFDQPDFSSVRLYDLAQSALAVALIGLIESIAIGRTLAYRRGETLDANREVVGQGLSNLVGGMMSSYVSAGSFTRSALNAECGARTPLSAILASASLVAMLLLIAPLVAYLPVPAVGGVILLVGCRLIDLSGARHILATSRSDAAIMSCTFVAALAIGLEFSVFIGVLLSLAVFLNDTMKAELELTAPNHARPNHSFSNVASGVSECPQLAFLRLNGPLYFGAADGIQRGLDWMARERPVQSHLVLKLTGVGQVDATGADLLKREARRRQRMGGKLYLTSRFGPLFARLKDYGVVDAVGDESIYGHRHDAIADIVPRLDPEICRTCRARIFRECPTERDI